MFTKTRKEKFVEQAQELANDLSEAIAPHVERARDELAPRLADAKDHVAPHVESARDHIVNELVPRVQQAVIEAREQATPVVEEAKSRSVAAAAALKGEPVKPKGRKRKILLFAGLAALGAVIAKRLTSGGESANWQSSYTPTPAPAPAAPPAPPSPAAPMAGSHVADVPGDQSSPGDPSGATPGESLSDAVEEPHPVTTPDSPAEDVDVSELEDPKP
jgi:hypothetical protein